MTSEHISICHVFCFRWLHLLLTCFLPALVSLLLSSSNSLALPPEYGEGGSGWDSDTAASAFAWGSRRGESPETLLPPALTRQVTLGKVRQALDDPANPAGGTGGTSDSGPGASGYSLAIPIVELPGRGLDLALDLHYDSRVWQKTSVGMAYDIDADWPAPGFILGFGKIFQFFDWQTHRIASFFIEPDGTRRPARLMGQRALENGGEERSWQTTDGSLIDYVVQRMASTATSNGAIFYAVAKYPNGLVVEYAAGSPKDFTRVIFPSRITDVNGNVVNIQYHINRQPQIDVIEDTLGRIVKFHYDAEQKLTAITAPGYTGGRRTLVRFNYVQIDINLENAFDVFAAQGLHAQAHSCKTPAPGQQRQPCPIQLINAVYYPGTRTGYWFGEADTYSSYGMPVKVSERRAMGHSASTLNEQGTITPGLMTRDRVYNYPLQPAKLHGAPTYSKMTETWEGMDVQPADTFYESDPETLTSTITMPDQSRIVRIAYKRPGQIENGLPFFEEVFDANSRRLKSTATVWETGSAAGYDSPRVKRIERTNELGQKAATEYEYGPQFNQVETVREFDYGGTRILRATRTTYETNSQYLSRHIFNLPKMVEGFAGEPSIAPAESRTEFDYDGASLLLAPGAAGRDSSYQQSSPNYNAATKLRGLVTQIRRYADTATRDPLTTQLEDRVYDETGNLVLISGSSCCEVQRYLFEPLTQYAWPSRIIGGAHDPNSPLRMEESFRYDINTGLLIEASDAGGRITRMFHFPDSLRPARITFPATEARPIVPSIVYEYDDKAMTVEERHELFVPEVGPPVVASQIVTWSNGLGLSRDIRSRAANGEWDVISLKYDVLGRLAAQSLPYRAGPPNWILQSNDPLGRLIAIETPGNSVTRFFYNEANRPSGATEDPGETLRRVDPVGRERWMLSDALDRVREIIDPDPDGWGSVFAGTPLITTYNYTTQSLYINQGVQQSKFRYDSLGRLTHQSLPGRDAVLDGPGSKKFSDVFVYNQLSQLIRHVDARGGATNYLYDNDPLRRLKRILGTTSDTAFEYMTSGDLRRPQKIATAGVGEEIYGYDGEGRLTSVKRMLPDRPQFPLEVGYDYDAFGRLAEQRYPAQFGGVGQSRKLVSYDYGLDSRPKIVKLDGEPVASDITYDPSGKIVSMTLGSPKGHLTHESYRYHANGLFMGLTVSRNNQDLIWTHYDYSAAGQMSLQLDSNEANQRGYSYDALGRLKTALSPPGLIHPGWTQTYFYDQYGNRTSTKAVGVTSTGTPIPTDGSAQLSVDEKTGKITTAGFKYDQAANLTHAPRRDGLVQDMEYDHSGRLVRVLTPEVCLGHTCLPNRIGEVYRYGPDRRRLVAEKLNFNTGQGPTNPSLIERTYYVWSGDMPIAEYSETAAAPAKPRWARSYLYLGARLFATLEPSAAGEEVRYHHPNQLGGTRLITNPAQDATVNQFVMPFGTVIETGATGTTGRHFTSYDRSQVTGLDYAVNRFYDPVTGRFIQPDPLGIEAVNLTNPQSLNAYAYVQNDPINNADPLGLIMQTVVRAWKIQITTRIFMPSMGQMSQRGGPGGGGGGGEASAGGTDTGRPEPNICMAVSPTRVARIIAELIRALEVGSTSRLPRPTFEEIAQESYKVSRPGEQAMSRTRGVNVVEPTSPPSANPPAAPGLLARTTGAIMSFISGLSSTAVSVATVVSGPMFQGEESPLHEHSPMCSHNRG
jgi:RHS repeat-associated protein